MAVLTAAGLAAASPVSPEAPESPERAVGLAVAVAEASPVSPVLVAEAWAVEAPVLPLVALGWR